jgi:hypothetical protein
MEYPLFNVFLTMLYLFVGILWIFLLMKVITDIFRSSDIGGWGKTAWMVFVILLPFLGVFVYVVARGKSMSEREFARMQHHEEAFQEYVRSTDRIPSQADELAKLAQLKDHGDISESEYEQAKVKLLG